MAKKKVMEMRWGTYEASYDNLPQLLNTIATLNPGSYYDIKTYNLVSRPGKQVWQRAFLSLDPTIAAFQQCRPVICIDGTFLIGRYKGTILPAMVANGTISCCHWQLLLQRERIVTVDIGFWRN
jgi:hypothetical protein